MRDELGVTETSEGKPIQAGMASAYVMLAVLGTLDIKAGGAPVARGVKRAAVFGTLATAVIALVGHFFHAAV